MTPERLDRLTLACPIDQVRDHLMELRAEIERLQAVEGLCRCCRDAPAIYCAVCFGAMTDVAEEKARHDQSAWHPASEPPDDDREVLCYDSDGQHVARWLSSGAMQGFTHWRELPPKPDHIADAGKKVK